MDTHERCRRCGRKLRSKRSRSVGYGRVCLWRIGRALPKGATQEQVDKAVQLIDDGGLAPVGARFRAKVFRIVSSRGDDYYLTCATHCTCPAGRREKLCYHRVAVAWVTA